MRSLCSSVLFPSPSLLHVCFLSRLCHSPLPWYGSSSPLLQLTFVGALWRECIRTRCILLRNCIDSIQFLRSAMGSREKRHFFPLTSLQIGDLQTYLSQLILFLASESDKLFILVDNRPWLIDKELRSAAHVWQFMVTKSRMSPFANTKARRHRKDNAKGFDLKNGSKSTIQKWFSVIDAALYHKKTLLPVKKLKDSFLLNSKLHQTLYGFIVFEVEWSHVRGINYLNELQTDTSLALEAKFMRRWEFDSIEQASGCISSWFSGTHHDQNLLQEYLNSISLTKETYYDAENDSSTTSAPSDVDRTDTKIRSSLEEKFLVESLPQTPSTPPPSGPYKRRKVTKYTDGISGIEADSVSEKAPGEIVSSPGHLVEATQYRDVLILFRFNDRDLPFRLKDIIMSDLRLLTLLESGLPSWVIFLQSYPLFCRLYRPWMCPLARALYVLISITTVLIGFYDLYKNVPVLKVAVSRLCGPLFIWIENWDMASRIKYLGTMLFLHNFEKAVKWSLMVARYTRSLISVVTEPLAGPLLELEEFFLPCWQFFLEAGEAFGSFTWFVTNSIYGMVVTVGELFLWPVWLILSLVWKIGIFLLWPIFWTFKELLYAPIRLVLSFTNLASLLCSSMFDLLIDAWLSISGIFQMASASQPTVTATKEVSMWSSLWSDLFSQIFRAVRSIVYGFVAFFAACNRHRLSIYNHILEFIKRVSCVAQRPRTACSALAKRAHGSSNHQLDGKERLHAINPNQPGDKAHKRARRRSAEAGLRQH